MARGIVLYLSFRDGAKRSRPAVSAFNDGFSFRRAEHGKAGRSQTATAKTALSRR